MRGKFVIRAASGETKHENVNLNSHSMRVSERIWSIFCYCSDHITAPDFTVSDV
jgi:hypothetical protein